MMKKVGWTAVAFLTFGAVAEARPPRVNQIPNGAENSCLTCHNSSSGGSRNVFGQFVGMSFLEPAGSSGVVQWGPSLANADSDRDGVTNGAELGDPLGAWLPGRPNPPGPISNPGDPNSTNVTDAGMPDANMPDANMPDAGVPDASVSDAGVDAGTTPPPTGTEDDGGCRNVGGQTVSWLLFGVGLAVWLGRRRRSRV